jgi:hypothetical protein
MCNIGAIDNYWFRSSTDASACCRLNNYANQQRTLSKLKYYEVPDCRLLR